MGNRREQFSMSGLNLFELRLYRRLGVLPFRRFLFGVERLRHRKDGGKNKNYHIGKLSVREAGRFEGYLLYNTFLHAVSLVLTGIFFVGKYIRRPNWSPWEIVLYVLSLLNIWCIMLQRYNWLRIRRLRLRHRQLRAERIRKAAEHSSGDFEPEDVRLVDRMLESLTGGEPVILESRDADGLRRMSVLLRCGEPEKRNDPQFEPYDESESIGGMMERCGDRIRPYGKLEHRVGSLQRLFMPGKRDGILAPCSVVTEDLATEQAFSALFPRKSRDAVEETLLILKAVMEKYLSGNKNGGRAHNDEKTFS